MEFLLINHPLDCPICDQAGECTLQDNSFGYGAQLSNYDEQKRQYPTFDRTMIGPHVVADMTRCIQCTRCIRFTQEIAGTSELTFLDRGGRTLVWTHDGAPLDNDWSGCAADVCPVGALTVREFRFRSRVWYLQKTKSVCPGCNVGCNVSIESKDDVVYRFLPRLNPAVNDYWLCDHGRFLSESLNARDVHKASIREGTRRPGRHRAGRDRADRARDPRPSIESTGPAGLFFLGSAHLSNEENFLLRKLADHLACPNRDVVVDKSRAAQDQVEDRVGRGRRRGRRTSAARATWAWRPGRTATASTRCSRARPPRRSSSSPTPTSPPLADDPEKVAVLRKARFLAVAARNGNALTRAADVVLPAASLAEKEGTFTNVQGRVQRFERAFLPKPPVRAHWELLLMLATALGYGDRNWTPADLLAADRGRGRGLRRRQGAGARGRSAAEEGRLRLGGDAVTPARLGDRDPARGRCPC